MIYLFIYCRQLGLTDAGSLTNQNQINMPRPQALTSSNVITIKDNLKDICSRFDFLGNRQQYLCSLNENILNVSN